MIKKMSLENYGWIKIKNLVAESRGISEKLPQIQRLSKKKNQSVNLR